jgi:hypothetical protein
MQFSLWLAKTRNRHNIFLILFFCIVMFLSPFVALYCAIKQSILEFWYVFSNEIKYAWDGCIWHWSKRIEVAKYIIEKAKNSKIKE